MRENKEMIRDNLNRIGLCLVRVLPEGWDRVVYGFFLTGDKQVPHQQIFVKTSGIFEDWFETNWDNEQYDDDVFTLENESQALHKYCCSVLDSWQSFTMSIDRSGQFSIDWDYREIPRIDSLFLIQWKNKYLD